MPGLRIPAQLPATPPAMATPSNPLALIEKRVEDVEADVAAFEASHRGRGFSPTGGIKRTRSEGEDAEETESRARKRLRSECIKFAFIIFIRVLINSDSLCIAQ